MLIGAINMIVDDFSSALTLLVLGAIGILAAFKIGSGGSKSASSGDRPKKAAKSGKAWRLAPPSPAAYADMSRREQACWDHSWHRFLYGFCSALGIAIAVGVYMMGFRWQDAPKVWGTYTVQEYTCSGYRHPCRDIGVWTSDDHSQVLNNMWLEDSLPAGKVVRAYTQPTTPYAKTTVQITANTKKLNIELVGFGIAFELFMIYIMRANHNAWKRDRGGLPCPRKPFPKVSPGDGKESSVTA